MIRTGYVTNFRGDLFWFLSLPFIAIAFALFARDWMSAIVLASVSLWVTFPHHFVTFLRTYGVREDWLHWKDQLIIGPLVIMGIAILGLKFAPLTLILLLTIWDHQHSLMQQHGIARIYDFKAKAGGPSAGRYDLAFNWIVYGNLIITAPLFTNIWLREVYRFGIPLSAGAVTFIQTLSWSVTGGFLVVYALNVLRTVRAGQAINPMKYAFLGASYFLWYFVSWQTDSVLVHGVAHRIMHGMQYIVIVWLYLGRTTAKVTDHNKFVAFLVKPKHIAFFAGTCLVYAAVYGLIVGQPLVDFGFGAVSLAESYPQIKEHNLSSMSPLTGYDLYATAILNVVAATHYYFDSFIWKVRVPRVQEGI